MDEMERVTPQPSEITHRCEVIRSQWSSVERDRRRRMAEARQRELSALLGVRGTRQRVGPVRDHTQTPAAQRARATSRDASGARGRDVGRPTRRASAVAASS